MKMSPWGMGVGPSDILNLVLNVLKNNQRKTPFIDSMSNYPQYFGFMAGHSDKLETRKEILCEASRSKFTKEVVDDWLEKYRTFLSERNLLDKPHKIYTSDKTGFTMESIAGVVVGPIRQRYTDDIPTLSGGSSKQCIVPVQKKLFYHSFMCILNPNLLHMILCQVQQEAQLFITNQKNGCIQMLFLHTQTISITMTDQLYF